MFDGSTMIAFVEVHVPLVLGLRLLPALTGGVQPDYRGRGIGTRLMDAAEERAVLVATRRHPGVAIRFQAPGGVESDVSAGRLHP